MNKACNCVILFILLLSIAGCQGTKQELIHQGENKTSSQSLSIAWDSIIIDAFNTSGQGNYFMIDSIISFADHHFARIYNYDCRSGELLSRHFGVGQGPNELQSFFLATPIVNDSSVFIIDGNLTVSTYNTSKYELKRNGMLNFGWTDDFVEDYDLPEGYNFMLMADLGANVYRYEKEIIIPIQPIIRNVCKDGLITSQHFAKSHIFGLLDINSMTVTKVFGHYPLSYQEKSLPHFNFFSYFMKDDLFYVNFPTDPLIYVYKYPDKLEYVFGYECNDINRNYTHANKIEDHIYNDFMTCGINTGIYDFPELQLHCRTYIKNTESMAVGMQVYNYSHDLIADIDLPSNFKLLGYFDSCFYGVSLTPKETDDNTFVTFYKGRIL